MWNKANLMGGRFMEQKIYLDTCCYNRPFDNVNDINVQKETAAKLFIQSLVRNGDILLVSSFVLYSEIMENPSEYKRNSILRFVDDYAKESIGCESSPQVLSIASEIVQTGVKAADAAHVACAILAECDSFVSTDKRLLKYKTDRIKLLNPVEFVKPWESPV
jgi:predicted nucleic acid-binding protein